MAITTPIRQGVFDGAAVSEPVGFSRTLPRVTLQAIWQGSRKTFRKKWLRKPACNSSTSQEKAGFITYSVQALFRSEVLEKSLYESCNVRFAAILGHGATSRWFPYHFHSPCSLMIEVSCSGPFPDVPVAYPARWAMSPAGTKSVMSILQDALEPRRDL
jgi:hypothetical protein